MNRIFPSLIYPAFLRIKSPSSSGLTGGPRKITCPSSSGLTGGPRKIILMAFLSFLFLTACDNSPLNNPHENTTQTEKILYTSFAEQPKTLDPAKSYSQNEYAFIAQIYEPVLQYHYLKRPYELVPLTANQMPTTRYYNANDEEVKENSKNIAYTIFDIQIQQNILYQPHPAFASKPEKGSQLHDSINDFKQLGTRELTAEDYVYQIKRLADPRNNSPIFGVMAEHIAGFGALREEIAAAIEKNKQLKRIRFVDLRKIDFEGARVTGRYRYEIKINNKYPQFLYWLAMPFFAPIPWEAEKFYSQPGMKDRNLSLKWYPVGTGPYLLHDNDPNRRMLLQRNPNFRGELYPSGDVDDRKMPTIDKVVFSLEKESIPRWNKFLQGYYDTSGIGSDSFDQAIEFSDDGQARLTEFMKSKDIQLRTSVAASVFYLGFNMLDDVVGGDSERARKLRQAISIAINYEEFIQIFLNGRGVSAQGPIPPGIFGHAVGKEEINPYVFDWENNKPKRKSIEYAQQLMREAGYEKGRDIQTGEQLVLNYDIPAAGGPDDKARFNWMRKQFCEAGY